MKKYWIRNGPLVLVLVVIVGFWLSRLGTKTWSDSITDLSINPHDFLSRLIHAWDPRILLGWDNGWGVTYLPLAAMFTLLHGAGIPLALCLRLWVGSVFVLCGASMAYFVRSAYPQWRVGVWIAAIGFISVPVIWVYGNSGASLLLTYAALPLLGGLAIRVSRNEGQHCVVKGALASLLLVGTSPPATLIPLLVVGALIAVLIATGDSVERRQIGRWLAGVTPLSLLLNVWWILPQVSNLTTHINTAAKAVENPIIEDRVASFLETGRLMGNWGIFGSWNGIPYYQDAHLLTTSALVVDLTFIPLAIAIIGLGIGVLSAHRERLSLFLIVMLCFSWFMSVGAHSPTGGIYLWFYNRIPGSIVFRSSYRWEVVVSFTIVLGVAMAYERCPRISDRIVRRVVIILISCSFIAIGWPLWAGHLIAKSALYTVPQYWYSASSWLNSQKGNFRVAYLPMQGSSIYSWGEPFGEPMISLVHHPAVLQQIGVSAANAGGNLFVSRLLTDLSDGDPSHEVAALCSQLGVRYIVQRNDYNSAYYNEPSAAAMAKSLGSIPTLVLEKTFGKLEIYRVRTPVKPDVYVSSRAQHIVEPLILGELVQSGPSWIKQTLTNLTVVQNFTITTRLEASGTGNIGVGFSGVDNSGYVVAELRQDGSRFEFWPNSKQLSGGPIGRWSGFIIKPSTWYWLTISRHGDFMTASVNGHVIMTATVRYARTAHPYLVAFQSNINVSAFTIRSQTGSLLYSMQLRQREIQRIPVGWTGVPSQFGVLHEDLISTLLQAPSARKYANTEILAFKLPRAKLSISQFNLAKLTRVRRVDGSHIELSVRSLGPFYVDFGETYDAAWVAVVNGRKVIPAKDHFESFGYENAWYIPYKGNLTIELIYTPDSMYRFLQVFSLLVFLGSLIRLVLVSRKYWWTSVDARGTDCHGDHQ